MQKHTDRTNDLPRDSENSDHPRKPRNALGSGIASFLDLDVADFVTAPDEDKTCWHVDIERIIADPRQPRRRFSDTTIAELADSIRQHGVLSPLVLRPGPDSSYYLVAGERRLRASKCAGLMVVPAIVRELSSAAAMECALIENIQRESLTPIEEAVSYLMLMEEHKYTQERLSKAVGKSRSHIANLVRLLDLPELVKGMVEDGLLSMGHARAILKADDPIAVANSVVEKELSVRQTERLIRKDPVKRRRGIDSHNEGGGDDLRSMEESLSQKLSLLVKIGKSEVTISYSNMDDLDLIIKQLMH